MNNHIKPLRSPTNLFNQVQRPYLEIIDQIAIVYRKLGGSELQLGQLDWTDVVDDAYPDIKKCHMVLALKARDLSEIVLKDGLSEMGFYLRRHLHEPTIDGVTVAHLLAINGFYHSFKNNVDALALTDDFGRSVAAILFDFGGLPTQMMLEETIWFSGYNRYLSMMDVIALSKKVKLTKALNHRHTPAGWTVSTYMALAKPDYHLSTPRKLNGALADTAVLSHRSHLQAFGGENLTGFRVADILFAKGYILPEFNVDLLRTKDVNEARDFYYKVRHVLKSRIRT